MDARKDNRLARQRLIVQIALCALLPPVGMLLVWRSRYPRRGKLFLSVLSSVILTLMISYGLSLRPPEDITPTPMSAGYIHTATPAPGASIPPTVSETVAPANPFG